MCRVFFHNYYAKKITEEMQCLLWLALLAVYVSSELN